MNSPFPSGDGFSLEEPLETPGGETAGGYPWPGPPAALNQEGSPPPAIPQATLVAMADVVAKRIEQVELHGHTPEDDDRRGLVDLVRRAAGRSGISAVLDYAHFRRNEQARRYLVKTAAVCLAAIELIDREETRILEDYPPL